MSNLSKEYRAKLNELEDLVTQYYEAPAPAKIGFLRKLSVGREVVNAIYIGQDTRRESMGIEWYTPNEMAMVSNIDTKVMAILEPVYESLLNKAIKDFKQWMIEIHNLNPYTYQLQTVYQILKIVIWKARPDIIYSLLISRGGGKSWSLSGLSSFLQVSWDKYILHNKTQDYGIAVATYVDKQLAEFRRNIRGFLANHFERTKSKDLVIKLNNEEEIVIYKNNRLFSKCMFRIATSSMESVHADLLLADEAKFYPRNNLYTSVLPCVGGRTGIKILISSAHEYYSEFQNIVERNIKKFKKDRIIRHIEFHWEKMIKYNPSYEMTVMSALSAVDGNRNDTTFATQYDNKFLSKGGSNFFNMNYMRDIKVIKNYSMEEYINNPNYTIIAGWDIAVTGDNSILTTKAIPNGHGENRKSTLLASIIMNESKSEAVDIVVKQIPRVVEYMAYFNVKAITVDCTGLGNGADIMLKEHIRTHMGMFKDGFDESHVIGFKFSEKSKVDLLDFYMNRLKGGQEILPDIEFYNDIETDDSIAETMYKQMYNNPMLDEYLPQMIRFYVEHKYFERKTEINESTKSTKTIYVQANYSWLHDDTIMSSAKASWCLRMFPELTNYSSDSTANYFNGNGSNFMFKGD